MTFPASRKLLGALAISLAATGSYGEENSPPATGGERCIPVKDIRRTEVVDDQNILFHLRNKKVYKNHLPHRCSGLAQAKAFQYATSQSELCNVDTIAVLSSTTGTLVPGASCALGMFEPVESKQTGTP